MMTDTYIKHRDNAALQLILKDPYTRTEAQRITRDFERYMYVCSKQSHSLGDTALLRR